MDEKIIADLHSHTINSDGTCTVEEVVELASQRGLKVIAITDHDTVDGLIDQEKIRGYEKKYGVQVINGIEMSCSLKGKDVHILGYFLNLDDKEFLDELDRISTIRIERNEEIIRKLNKVDVPITMEDVNKIVKGNIVSRAHFAQVMLEKGYVISKAEAFKSYIGKNGLAYVEKKNYPPSMAVETLNKNGAFISLAHPKLITDNFQEVEELVKSLVPLGLRGLEVNYSSFTGKDKKLYRKLAKRHNLIITGGSDFHGENRAGVSVGDAGLNEEEYENMKKSLKIL